jgi:hypothetical protein
MEETLFFCGKTIGHRISWSFLPDHQQGQREGGHLSVTEGPSQRQGGERRDYGAGSAEGEAEGGRNSEEGSCEVRRGTGSVEKEREEQGSEESGDLRDEEVFVFGYGLSGYSEAVWEAALNCGDQDLHEDADFTAGNLDTLRFGNDILPADVGVRRRADDLVFTIKNTQDMATIGNYFRDDSTLNLIEQIQFADGTLWGVEEIKQRVLQATEGDDILIAYPYGDTIQGLWGNDKLYGRRGDDNLQGDDADDLLSGGAGYDVLDRDGDERLDNGIQGGALGLCRYLPISGKEMPC